MPPDQNQDHAPNQPVVVSNSPSNPPLNTSTPSVQATSTQAGGPTTQSDFEQAAKKRKFTLKTVTIVTLLIIEFLAIGELLFSLLLILGAGIGVLTPPLIFFLVINLLALNAVRKDEAMSGGIYITYVVSVILIPLSCVYAVFGFRLWSGITGAPINVTLLPVLFTVITLAVTGLWQKKARVNSNFNL